MFDKIAWQLSFFFLYSSLFLPSTLSFFCASIVSACHVQNRHEKSSPVQAEGTYFSRLPVEEKKAFTSSFPLSPPPTATIVRNVCRGGSKEERKRGNAALATHIVKWARGESGEDDGERDSQWRSTV